MSETNGLNTLLSTSEVEMLRDMIQRELNHAARSLLIQNTMGAQQHDKDMERVRLLEKIIKAGT